MDITTVLLFVVLLFFAQKTWERRVNNGITTNQGPTPIFLVGNLPLILFFGTKLDLFVGYLRKKYGKMFQFWMGWKRVVYCGEPKVVKKILTSDAETFEKLHWEKHVLAPVMEGGLIILNGDDWKIHHRTINPFFNSELYSVLCKEVVNSFEKVWPHQHTPLEPIKLQRQFRMLSSDILSKLIFGWSFREKGILDYFVDTVELLNHELEERAKDILTLRPYVAPIEVATTKKAKAEGEQLLLRYIREARQARADSRHNNEGNNNSKFRYLIDIMLDDKDFSDMDILHEIKTLFGASETTVHLLTWGVYALAQNPHVESKLLDELESYPDEHPNTTLDQINNSTYLNAVVNECLRMFPPAPAMFRQAVRSTELTESMIVDEGTVVAICPFFIHKDTDYWDSPEIFMPERFLEKANCKEWQGDNVNNPAFIPFGNGKRQCIGKKFSLIEASALLACLVKSYKFSVAPNQKIEPVTDILNRPRYGIEVFQHSRPPAQKDGANEGEPRE